MSGRLDSDVESSAVSQRPVRLERMLALHLLGTALIVLIALVVVFFATSRALREAGEERGKLHEQIADLRTQVQALRDELEGVERRAAEPAHAQPATSPRQSLAAPREGRTTPRSEPRQAEAPAAEAQRVIGQDVIRRRLDEQLGRRAATVGDLADPVGATELLDTALSQVARARWSGETWGRLALLATLLERPSAAEELVERAQAAGEGATECLAAQVRRQLSQGQVETARQLAESLAAQTSGSPVSRLLLAAAALREHDVATAEEVLGGPLAVDELSVYDRLLLARSLVELEKWPRVGNALAGLADVPEYLLSEFNFLTAVHHARSQRMASSVALLDYLRAHPPAPDATIAASDWPAPVPSLYEVALWRGVALMLAGQFEPARDALEAARDQADMRPEAHYYLGLLSQRENDLESAKGHVQQALARAAQYAPAWEALALLELDSGRPDEALAHTDQAIEINPYRASAYFLAAVAHAQRNERQPAAEALEVAFQLDEQYLLRAKETGALLKHFTPAELNTLAAGPEQKAG